MFCAIQQGYKFLKESAMSSEIDDSTQQAESEHNSGSHTLAETKSSDLVGMAASAAAAVAVATSHGLDETSLAVNTIFNVDII